MFRLFSTLGLFFVIGIESVSAQIAIQNFTEAVNNRFSNDASFIGADYDFSGVGRATNGKWGTLISPNAVLSAHHVRLAPNSILEFYPGNDPNSTPIEAIVTTTVRVGSTDLSISILDRNVDPGIAVYSFATDEYKGDEPATITNSDGSTSTQTFIISDPAIIGIAGSRALVFGVSPAVNPGFTTDHAVGENLITGYSENVRFGSNTDNDTIILENDAEGTTNALTYETRVQSGDSGAPTFIIDDASNELVLIGINSFQLDGDPPSTFQSSGVTYTGNQVAEINAILSDNAIVPPLLGDCNSDSVVDFSDISSFITILSTNDYLQEADINLDDTVDFSDISPFIIILQSND
ncbi:hypothetical protein N9Y42_03570 [Mariniblastus sp.]|nr:hypothetical protein [Mariniblastus sp.]